MFAVIVADSCRLVAEGSVWWYLWGCFLSPYVIVALCSSVALACYWALTRRLTAAVDERPTDIADRMKAIGIK